MHYCLNAVFADGRGNLGAVSYIANTRGPQRHRSRRVLSRGYRSRQAENRLPLPCAMRSDVACASVIRSNLFPPSYPISREIVWSIRAKFRIAVRNKMPCREDERCDPRNHQLLSANATISEQGLGEQQSGRGPNRAVKVSWQWQGG
jgi:hypothetical protein